MPEDLADKITDFGLMLEGFCADIPESNEKTRLLMYWYALAGELGGKKQND